MAAQSGSKAVVYAALIGNSLIAVTKFIAAYWTGSSAMLSEAVHSLVDTGNELLLLYGLRRAARPPDATHPLGHGRELYFWSFVVALLIFALGAGVSLYEGVIHILDPEAIENPTINYVVLALSLVFEGGSWWVAFREFRKEKGELGYVAAIRRSKDPTTFTVLVEDSVALIGLVMAFASIIAARTFDMPELDGVGSIGIGLLLGGTAIFLARESKNLLIGEPALPEVRQAILDIASSDPDIRKTNGVITSQLGPNQIVAALSADFEDRLTTPEIEACIERLEARLHEQYPTVTAIFVKPQRHETWAERAKTLAD
jgi:cation diffusion facilitator family transporter